MYPLYSRELFATQSCDFFLGVVKTLHVFNFTTSGPSCPHLWARRANQVGRTGPLARSAHQALGSPDFQNSNCTFSPM